MPSLVRALLQEQHPDLLDLKLVDIGEGWDNRLFRLGDDLAVRLPRRAASAHLIEHEQRWLPSLSGRLPLAVPVPRRTGLPGHRFPWSWSITSWFPGQTALKAPPRDLEATAVALGQFLGALHQPAPPDAPHNPWRGVPLGDRDKALREHLRQLDGLVNPPPSPVCGSARFPQAVGQERPAGFTATFTLPISWSATAVSRP